jgi:hypothetical protein
MTYHSRITQMTVLPEGEPIFHELATTITIEDESTGEFLIVKQIPHDSDMDKHAIAINPAEWPLIKHTIDKMIESLREEP